MTRRTTPAVTPPRPAPLTMTFCTSEGPVFHGSLAAVKEFAYAMEWLIGDYSSTRLVMNESGEQVVAVSTEDGFAFALLRDGTGKVRAYVIRRTNDDDMDLMLLAR